MKNSIINKQTITTLIASLLIFLFVYTGLNKLMDIESFRFTLASSRLLKNLSTVLAWAIPLSELGISLLLFIPSLRIRGFLLSIIMLASFTLYIAFMLLFIPGQPCSCGGVIKKMTWPQHLVFNIFFTLLSFVGWKLNRLLNKNFIAINRQSRTPV